MESSLERQISELIGVLRAQKRDSDARKAMARLTGPERDPETGQFIRGGAALRHPGTGRFMQGAGTLGGFSAQIQMSAAEQLKRDVGISQSILASSLSIGETLLRIERLMTSLVEKTEEAHGLASTTRTANVAAEAAAKASSAKLGTSQFNRNIRENTGMLAKLINFLGMGGVARRVSVAAAGHRRLAGVGAGALALAIKGLITVFKTLAAFTVVLAGAMVLAAFRIRRAAASLFQEGFVARQVGDMMVMGTEAINRMRDRMGTGALITGALADPEEVTKVITALAGEMGSIHNITDDMLDTSLRLTGAWGATADQAAGFRSLLRDIYGENERLIQQDIMRVEQVAIHAGIPMVRLMEMIAETGDEFVASSQDGMINYVKSAAALAKARVDMQSLVSLADSMTGNFEGFLQKQASLQTLFPGMDLTGVMMASQFGTALDVAQHLQTALVGAGVTDISQMPRSFRNMLVSEFGIPLTQLTRIISEDLSAITEDDLIDIAPLEDSNERIARALSEGNPIVNALTSISNSLAAIAAFPIFRLFAGQGDDADRRNVGMGFAGLGAGAGGLTVALLGAKLLGGAGLLGGGPVGGLVGGSIGAVGGGLLGLLAPGFIERMGEDVRGERAGPGGGRGIESFHTGGIVRSRTAQDELIVMLQRGETVLTRSQTAGLQRMMKAVETLGDIGQKFQSTMGLGNIQSRVETMFEGFGGMVESLSSGKIGDRIREFATQQTGGLLDNITGILGGGGSGGGIGDIIKGGIGRLFGGGGEGGGGLLSGIGGLLGGGGIGTTIGSAIGSIIPGAGTALGGLVGSLGGRLVGGIGRRVGRLFGRGRKKPKAPEVPDLSVIMGSQGGMASILGMLGQLSPTGATANEELIAQTQESNQQIINKLDELIGLLKAGAIAVHMDGRKVTDALSLANSRG